MIFLLWPLWFECVYILIITLVWRWYQASISFGHSFLLIFLQHSQNNNGLRKWDKAFMNHVTHFMKSNCCTVFWDEPGRHEANVPVGCTTHFRVCLCSSPSTHFVILNFASSCFLFWWYSPRELCNSSGTWQAFKCINIVNIIVVNFNITNRVTTDVFCY